MHTLQGTTRRVVACSLFGLAIVATLVSACSDDNGGSGASPSGGDAAADQSTPNIDSSSEGDVTTTEASTGDDASGDGSATLVSDAAADVVTSDVSAPGDAGSTDGAVSDANGPNDAATADASEAGGGACVTTLASLGSSGTNDAATPTILDDFDGQADAGPGSGWSAYFTGATATLSVTDTDGHTCNGALDFAVTAYTSYGTNVQAYFNYNSSVQDWTGYKKLHAWLKVVSSDYSTIQGVEPRVDSNAYGDKLYGGFVSGSTFADGGWHETVVPLTAGASYVPAMVNGYQFEFQLVGAQPGGAPAVPPAATMLVDSIWIE